MEEQAVKQLENAIGPIARLFRYNGKKSASNSSPVILPSTKSLSNTPY
jgi:hypothetical protein